LPSPRLAEKDPDDHADRQAERQKDDPRHLQVPEQQPDGDDLGVLHDDDQEQKKKHEDHDASYSHGVSLLIRRGGSARRAALPSSVCRKIREVR